jgi:hypothetical protein
VCVSDVMRGDESVDMYIALRMDKTLVTTRIL